MRGSIQLHLSALDLRHLKDNHGRFHAATCLFSPTTDSLKRWLALLVR